MSQRRTTMRWLAVAALVVGLVAGTVLLVMAANRPSQIVDKMARAPVGCTTTLRFAKAGTYYVWQESSSNERTVVDGCEPQASATGQFSAELSGEGLTVVRQDPPDAPMYSIDGYASTRVMTQVDLTGPAEVEIAVSGPDADVMAAVGRDPGSGVDALRAGGIGAIVAGLGLMALLLLLGRKKVAEPEPAAVPAGYTPAGYGYQPYHPYGQQPGSPPQQPGYPQQPPQPQYPYQPQTPPQPSYGQQPYQQPGQSPYQRPQQPGQAPSQPQHGQSPSHQQPAPERPDDQAAPPPAPNWSPPDGSTRRQ